jgi:hypothetical protein
MGLRKIPVSSSKVLNDVGLGTIHSSVVEFCSTAQGLGARLFSLVGVGKTTTKKQEIPATTETYESKLFRPA